MIRGPETKPRLLVGIANFLISHSVLVSVISYASGVLALFLLPVFSKTTSISENALMPGSANTMFSAQDIAIANRLMKDITKSSSVNSGVGIPRLIAIYMSDLGADVNYHKFLPPLNGFHPLNFFACSDSGLNKNNINTSSCGVNIVGVVRAPRGDGKESIVLVTPYNSASISPNEVLSLGIAYSVFSLLSRVNWLSKDIVFVAADSQFGEYKSVSAWLRDYHSPVFSDLETTNSESCDGQNIGFETKGNKITENTFRNVLRRAGTMYAALIIKVISRNGENLDTVRIYPEASNGQMPNQDLFNIVKLLAAHKQGFLVKVDKLRFLLDSKTLKTVGVFFEFLGKVIRDINPQWKFGIPVADYIEGSATFAYSLYLQALGVPTGSHGAFRDYQVDAITLELSPRFSLSSKARKSDFLLRSGSLLEGVIRSINNLLEKLHQSYFLYLLSSPDKFIPLGVYMIAFALLVAPLPIVAASLYIDANKRDPLAPASSGDDKDVGFMNLGRSWIWIRAAKQVFAVHFLGALFSFLPYFFQMASLAPAMSFLTWVLFSVSGLIVARRLVLCGDPKEWGVLKSVTISAVFMGLCLMSVVNFAAAEFGALWAVPMCLMAYPLKLDLRARGLRGFARGICNGILGFVGFPPVAALVAKAVSGGGVNVGALWALLESLRVWNSATYVYIFLVHLPCWVLCIHVFFHPC